MPKHMRNSQRTVCFHSSAKRLCRGAEDLAKALSAGKCLAQTHKLRCHVPRFKELLKYKHAASSSLRLQDLSKALARQCLVFYC